MLKYVFILATFALTSVLHAADSFYCPQNSGYINIGMSQQEVRAACGEPTQLLAGANTVTQQIPVTQLVYSTINSGPVDYYQGIAPIYSMWSLPSGTQGVTLQVNLVNNRVSAITLNQEQTNAVSACSGGTFQIGDDIDAVMTACGAPNVVNNSYIDQEVPKDNHPEKWVYDLTDQPSITLTFVNGILQSIQ